MRNTRWDRGQFINGVACLLTLSACGSETSPAHSGPKTEIVNPVDDRPVETPAQAALPVSGGTLTIAPDGASAIVADPERDRVSIVDLASFTLRSTVELSPGDEPGRSVVDTAGRAHVALRRGGAVVSIDLATGSVLNRRAVCKAPRGIAFDGVTGRLHVACAEGVLVSLPAEGGNINRTIVLVPDVRDVVVHGSELWVTLFKSAQVVRVRADGTLAESLALPGQLGFTPQPSAQVTRPKVEGLQPEVAWRALTTSGGDTMVVHQLAVTDDVAVALPHDPKLQENELNDSAYGGKDREVCDGIVKNAVTVISSDGRNISTGELRGAPLPVDISLSPDGTAMAVAHAAPADPSVPRPYVIVTDENGVQFSNKTFGSGAGISVFPLPAPGDFRCTAPLRQFLPQPATAVAFAPDGRLYAQTREPSQLLLVPMNLTPRPQDPPEGPIQALALADDSRFDTGHELFHRDSGGGIACASCHPEGGEDGHTWHFVDIGARRTQALHVGLEGTAPFHWDGALPDVGAIMNDVFVSRMGGLPQTPERVDALSSWLYSIPRPPAIRDAADPAAERGRALFQSTEVGCATCHDGPKLTNNTTVAVDTAREQLQVPSLVAIGYRSPFMHDGCAATLAARFDPACGGNAHGNTAALSPEQLRDLVSYLETL